MKTTYANPVLPRFSAFVFALLASAVVLGSTVAGMQPRSDAGASLIVAERVVVTATRTN